MNSYFIPKTQAVVSKSVFMPSDLHVHCDDINCETTHGVEISGTRNGPLFIHYCSPCVPSMINHCHYLESTEKCSEVQQSQKERTYLI